MVIGVTGEQRNRKFEIWKLPVAGSHSKKEAQLISTNPAHDLWQGRYSSDGRWVVFEAHNHATTFESTIYVVESMGGHRLASRW